MATTCKQLRMPASCTKHSKVVRMRVCVASCSMPLSPLLGHGTSLWENGKANIGRMSHIMPDLICAGRSHIEVVIAHATTATFINLVQDLLQGLHGCVPTHDTQQTPYQMPASPGSVSDIATTLSTHLTCCKARLAAAAHIRRLYCGGLAHSTSPKVCTFGLTTGMMYRDSQVVSSYALSTLCLLHLQLSSGRQSRHLAGCCTLHGGMTCRLHTATCTSHSALRSALHGAFHGA